MSVEQNKRVFRSIPEVIFNTGALSKIGEYFASDYVEHAALPPGWPAGIAGVERYISELRAAFPDLHATILFEAGEENRVAGRIRMRGTNLGSFMGMPASGKVIEWTESHFGRMEGGKLVEHWADWDQLGMMQQMGIIPEMHPEGAPAPSAH